MIRPSRRVLSLLAAAAVLSAACGSSEKIDPNSTKAVETLYAEGKDELASGGYDRAIKIFERVEGRAAGTLLAQQAEIEHAWVLYKSGEKAQSLAILDRFIKLHPTSAALDYAMYLQGVVNFNDDLGLLSSISRQDLSERDQQAARDSYQSFRQLVEQFPKSVYAADARQRMNYIVNTLAAYEVHVARYYFRRGAYVAAANRAQQAVQDFQQSPATEEALFILVQSYDRLGLKELRDDARRVLVANFPDSKLSSQGLGGRTRAWWQLW
jgi:outer membrane protein assembly factor BamD